MNAKNVGVMNEREDLLLLRNQNVYIIVGLLCPNENKPRNRGRNCIVYVEFKEKNKKHGNTLQKKAGLRSRPCMVRGIQIGIGLAGSTIKGMGSVTARRMMGDVAWVCT